uniref:PLA2c domain-containing protein n=1 Tax=Hucho hucho TaxID=62062 RepID=A0A4W5L3G8_9TELE
MLKPNDTFKTVRLSYSINDEERKYVMARKTLIKKWLKDQGIYCELEDVPNIALLGSGGGERAAVGMLGSLHQLAQDNLLDSLLYMCGVSGTTWCMSSLYSDPALSLSERCDEMIKKLKGSTVDLSKAVEWLKLRKEQNQDFNLTDFWGAFTASYFIKEVSLWLYSHIIKPYPIYSAIELDWVWFEMTPHESGFSGLGAFVPTSCLGSKFEGGTLREKRKEMDMVLLQGGERIDTQTLLIMCISYFLGLSGRHFTLGTPDSPKPSPREPLPKKLRCFLVTLFGYIHNSWLMRSDFARHRHLLTCQGHCYTNVPSSMASKEKIHLVDAGLKINSPYPPVLRTSRDVDLIISLDFSAGDPFETVFRAKDYARQQKVPFPPVKESVREEKDHPRDCYVFEGRRPEEPTIMHMPLFNLQNCQGLRLSKLKFSLNTRQMLLPSICISHYIVQINSAPNQTGDNPIHKGAEKWQVHYAGQNPKPNKSTDRRV